MPTEHELYYLERSQEPVRLASRPLAAGGEGELFELLAPSPLKGLIAKIFYLPKRTTEKQAKIQHLIQHPPEGVEQADFPIAWPLHALFNAENQFVGYLMPQAKGKSLEVLCSPKLPINRLDESWRRLSRSSSDSERLRLKVCYNMAVALYRLHQTGTYTLVDLKPDNVLLQSNGWITLVDIDSVQVTQNKEVLYKATVATPEYTPAEYYEGTKPTTTMIPAHWDEFSLAIIFYRILYGIHPYAATSRSPYQNATSLGDKIKEGLFVHNPQMKQYFSVVPSLHQLYRKSDNLLKGLFDKTLLVGAKEPTARATAQDWLLELSYHPLLLTNRVLPSQKIALNTLNQKNWYEIAVEQLLQEKQNIIGQMMTEETQPNSTPLLADNNSHWLAEIKKSYQQIGRFIKERYLLLTFLFTGIILAFLMNDTLYNAWQFISVIVLLALVTLAFLPLLLVSVKSTSQQYENGVNSLKQKFGKPIAMTLKQKLKYWEGSLYSFYQQRGLIKQDLRRMKTELDLLQMVKEKKEKEIYKKNKPIIDKIGAQTQAAIAEEMKVVSEKDKQAKYLMGEEVAAIKKVQQEVTIAMNSQPKLKRLSGVLPAQKLAYLKYENELDTLEKSLLEAELRTFREDYQAKLLQLKKEFDHKHQLLHQGNQSTKLKVADILESFKDKVQDKMNLNEQLEAGKFAKQHQQISLYEHHISQKIADLSLIEKEIKIAKKEIEELSK